MLLEKDTAKKKRPSTEWIILTTLILCWRHINLTIRPFPSCSNSFYSFCMHFSLCSLDSFQFPAHLFQFLLVDTFRFSFNNANTFHFKVFVYFVCTFSNSSLGISDVISAQSDGKSYHSESSNLSCFLASGFISFIN